MKDQFLWLLLFVAVTPIYSQVEFSGKVDLNGFYSNKETLPFWFYSNQRGRISDSTNFAGWVLGKMNYEISKNTSLELGGGVFYDDKFQDEVFLDELYADLKWKKLELIVGRKQKEEFYNGLSATNENFAWSLNARPIPGIQLRTSAPIYFNENKKLGFEFSWNEFLLENDRFVKGAHLHYKSLYLVYNFKNDWHLKAGIKHFAQWGGDSPIWGPQPTSFSEYLRVVAGREGGEDALETDQVNVIGSHLATYEVYLTKNFSGYSLSFIYNHFFEDGSGSRYANFPDGRYGIFYEKNDEQAIVNSLIYEFYYTKNQSQHSSSPHKNDFYFFNGVYRSGWTYKNRIIGVPFFDFDSSIPQIVGNKFVAHHLGLSGNLFLNKSSFFPYKLLASFVHKEGIVSKAYPIHRNELYLSNELGLMHKPFNLSVQIGTEFSNVAKPIFGTGLSLSKSF